MRRVRHLSIFTVVSFCVVMLLGLTVVARDFAESFAHPNRYTVYNPPTDLPYEEVSFTTEDDIRIDGWYIPPPGDSDSAIIYLHGLGANRDNMTFLAQAFYERGIGALLIDTRVHGTSGGDYGTMGLEEVADVQAAAGFLTARGIDRYGVMGNSYGASVALMSAPHLPDASFTVAASPYSSLVSVVADRAWSDLRLPPRPVADLVMGWMAIETGRNPYLIDATTAITQVEHPVLLIHGEDDPMTPAPNYHRLMEAAGGDALVTGWLLPNTGHHDIWLQVSQQRPGELTAFVLKNFGIEDES